MAVQLPQDLGEQLSDKVERVVGYFGLSQVQRDAAIGVLSELEQIWDEHDERGGVLGEVAKRVDSDLSPVVDRLSASQDSDAASAAIDALVASWRQLKTDVESF